MGALQYVHYSWVEIVCHLEQVRLDWHPLCIFSTYPNQIGWDGICLDRTHLNCVIWIGLYLHKRGWVVCSVDMFLCPRDETVVKSYSIAQNMTALPKASSDHHMLQVNWAAGFSSINNSPPKKFGHRFPLKYRGGSLCWQKCACREDVWFNPFTRPADRSARNCQGFKEGLG